jgi:hypothetical protein
VSVRPDRLGPDWTQKGAPGTGESSQEPVDRICWRLAAVYLNVSLTRFTLFALALLCACGPSSGPLAAATPSSAATGARVVASPSSQPSSVTEGVLMLTGPGQLGSTTTTQYRLYVITVEGRIVRSATAAIQSAGWHLPRFSVAGRSVYFLDGDSDLKVLRSDGSVGSVGRLPGGPADRVVFAVSPDEKQIAYSVLHYAGSGTTTTSLRVGALASLNVVEIFSGSPIEYPIGWSAGRLVVAVTPHPAIQNNGEVNPYFADEYHIVDPVTAKRIYSTSPTCGQPQGPVNAAGTACRQTTGNILLVTWTGASQDLGNGNYAPPAVLNPDGHSVAVAIATPGPIGLLSGAGVQSTTAAGTPAGWFDANHLFFFSGPCCAQSTSAAVLDVKSNSVTPVSSGLSGDADPYAPFFVSIPNSLN